MRWEPCGLVQMEAMRLGTLPIVAPTGGLKDTVEESKCFLGKCLQSYGKTVLRYLFFDHVHRTVSTVSGQRRR